MVRRFFFSFRFVFSTFRNAIVTGSVIAKQLLDVSIRVQAVRPFAVSEMTSLLESFPETTQSGSMYEVLYAAAWIVGEFSSDSNEPERSLNVLLKHRSLPGHIQGVYVQNILKLFTRIVTDFLEHKDVQGILRVMDLLFFSVVFIQNNRQSISMTHFSYAIYYSKSFHHSSVPVTSKCRNGRVRHSF